MTRGRAGTAWILNPTAGHATRPSWPARRVCRPKIWGRWARIRTSARPHLRVRLLDEQCRAVSMTAGGGGVGIARQTDSTKPKARAKAEHHLHRSAHGIVSSPSASMQGGGEPGLRKCYETVAVLIPPLVGLVHPDASLAGQTPTLTDDVDDVRLRVMQQHTADSIQSSRLRPVMELAPRPGDGRLDHRRQLHKIRALPPAARSRGRATSCGRAVRYDTARLGPAMDAIPAS